MMRRVTALLISTLLGATTVFAQYEVYEVPVPEDFKAKDCHVAYFTPKEEIIWHCSGEYPTVAYVTDKSGTRQIFDGTGADYLIMAWGGADRYVKWYWRGENEGQLERCDPECVRIPPPAGRTTWYIFGDVSGQSDSRIRFNDQGDLLIATNPGSGLSLRYFLLPVESRTGEYSVIDYSFKDQSAVGDVRTLFNESRQFATWAYGNGSRSGFWDGKRFYLNPRGVKADFMLGALTNDGELIGSISDVSWNLHLYSIRNGRKREIPLRSKKLFPLGSVISGAWPAADGSVLLVISSPKGRFFLYVKDGKVKYLNFPTVKDSYLLGHEDGNACGSVVITNYPYRALNKLLPRAFIFHRIGC